VSKGGVLLYPFFKGFVKCLALQLNNKKVLNPSSCIPKFFSSKFVHNYNEVKKVKKVYTL